MDIHSRLCLEGTDDNHVHFAKCDPLAKKQRWRFTLYTGAYEKLFSVSESEMGRMSSWDSLERQFRNFVEETKKLGLNKLR